MRLERIERSSVTCIIADDHPPILDALARYLAWADFRVIATARDGEHALEMIKLHRPTVCITDVRMPSVDGLEVARRAARTSSGTAVLLYSGFSDRALVADALDAGARGFALKEAPLGDLARAIDFVASGNVYVDPVLAADLARAERAGEHASVTLREREILRLLAAGSSYGEIAAQLFLAPETVRAHAHHAMTKLGARSRTQAVATALRESLIA